MKTRDVLCRAFLVSAAVLGIAGCRRLFLIGLGDKVDILPPGIRIVTSEGIQNGSYVRGTVTVSGEVDDDVGVASVSWVFTDSISGTSSAAAPAVLDAAGTSWSFTLDTTQEGGLYADGEKNFVLTVTDGAGKTTETRLLLIFDNTPPQASFINPQNGTTVYSTVTLRGSSSDNSRLSKVELRIGQQGTGSGDGFVAITGGLYDWTRTFLSNDYANAGQSDERGDGTWDLPIYCRVYDIAGNVSTNEPSDADDPLYPAALAETYGSALTFDAGDVASLTLLIDLDRDKPSLSIQMPRDGVNTAGTVLVGGTCSDENPGVASVGVQIEALDDDMNLIKYVKPDGTATTSAVWTEATLNSSKSYWQISINDNEALYSVASNHNGELRITAKPTDGNGKDGNTASITLRLDNTIPRLESPVFALNGTDWPAQDYLYAKGVIVLKATARDDQAVTSIKMSLDGGSSYGSELIGTSSVTENAANDYDLAISIDTLTNSQIPLAIRSAKNGLLTVGIKIQDNASPAPYVNTWFATLNMDNLYPTASYTGTSANSHDPLLLAGNATSSSQIMGTSNDGATAAVKGIDKIEVYLVRGSNVLRFDTGASVAAGTASFGDPAASAAYTTNASCKAVIDWTKVGAVDNMALTQNGSDVDWWVKPDTTVFADGSVEIHYVTWDEAGNAVHGVQSGFIRNKVPVISSVTVGSDLDDNDTVDADEMWPYDPMSPITARNDSLYLKVNTTLTGYNTPFTFSITCTTPSGDSTNYADSSGVAAIDTAGKFGGDGDGKVFTVKITDAVGIVVQQTVTVDIKNTDAEVPTITVDAIANPDDLTDWDDVELEGHIDTASLSSYDNSGTTDADVSGTVMIRGSAHDNTRIDAITLSVGGGAAVQIAHWGGSDLVADVAAFHVDSETLTDSGHDIVWEYKWNTAGIAGVADDNVELAFVATDSSSNPSAAGTRQYDVVPYITSLTTAVTGYTSSSFTRSALGCYPVQTGEAIAVEGYNLCPTNTGAGAGASDVRVVSAGSRDTTTSAGNGRGLDFSGVGGDYTGMTVTISTTATDSSIGSGYLVVWTNGVPSINARSGRSNAETNFVSSSGTDERWLTVWDLTVFETDHPTATNANHAVYPSMAMDGDTPVFAYVNNVQGYGIASYWNGSAEWKIYENWDLFTFTSLDLNDDGDYASLHDINVVSSGSQYVGDKGGILTSWFYQPPNTTWGGTSSFYRDYHVWLDNLWKSATFQAVLGRYLYPDLKVIGTTAVTTVFYSVYDSIDDKVIARSFKVGTDYDSVGTTVDHKITDNTSNIVYTNIAQQNQNATWPAYTDDQTNNRRFAQDDDAGVSPGGAYTIETGAGPWTAVAGTSGGVVLVVWYDTAANALKYAYNTAPDVSGGGSFTGTRTLASMCGGDFVDMVVDDDDHVHIAYHDSYSGDLKYVYIDSYNGTPTTAYTVDSYLTVGNKAGLAVGGDGVPVIAYKGMGNTAKVAWLVGTLGDGVDGNDKFSGVWEAQVLPTKIVDNDSNRFCAGVDSDYLPVVGYTYDGIEHIRRLADLP